MKEKPALKEAKPIGQRRWLQYREAGELLGVSGETIRMMVRRGKLPYSSIGKRVFIDRQDLEKTLEASKSYATAAS